MTYVSFLVFGVGLWQMNLVPLVFSALILIALFILAKKYFPESRLLFFILLTLNYPYGIFSRINDQVMPMTFFVIPAVFFFLKAWDKSPYFFLSSLFLCLSFLSKSKMLYFHAGVIPLAFLLIVIQRGEVRNFRLHFVRIGYFLGGLLLVAVPWFFFVFSRYPAVFENIAVLNVQVALPRTLSRVLVNWFLRPPFTIFRTNAALSIPLFLYFAGLLFTFFAKKKPSQVAPLEIIFSLWLIIGLAANSVIAYRPIRHYVEFTIPLVFLSGLFLRRLLSGSPWSFSLKKRPIFFFGSFLLIWLAVTSYPRSILSRGLIIRYPGRILLATLFISLVLTAVLYWLVNVRLAGREFRFPKRAAVAATIILVGVYAFQSIREYGIWVKTATYNLKTIGRDLEKAFPHGVFSGLLAPSLSLENRNIAHTSWPHYANDDPEFLKREHVTHLFLGKFNFEPEYYQRNFQEDMQRAKFLVRYHLWRSDFLLYEIQKESSPLPPASVYEAEQMQRETGQPLFDERAGNRFSVFINEGGKGIIGRETVILPGQRKIQGRLFVKLRETASGQDLRLSVRIFKKGVLVYKKRVSLRGGNFSPDFQPLGFECFVAEDGEYILEIRTSGNSAFDFDKVELKPQD